MNVYCLALASVAAFLALDAGAFRADDGNRPDTGEYKLLPSVVSTYRPA